MNKQQRREWRDGVFGHPELTAAQKLVLLKLETFADYPEGTNARPGVAALADQCRLKPRAVEGALQLGRSLELIEQTGRANPRRGHAAVYRLVSTRTSTRPDHGSTCTATRIDDGFNPHDGADGMEVQPAQNGFQPARDDVSTRTPVQPTNPITPIHNTNPPARSGEVERQADELLDDNISTPLNRASRAQLRKQVSQLIDDNCDHKLIGQALQLWDDRPDAGPGLLPHLYTDALKQYRELKLWDSVGSTRAAIDACDQCDQYGRDIYDSAVDCPLHANFLERSHR